jgi:hypothetical protein
MTPVDYYRTLGLTREATAADIRRAYRKLVKDCHPDRGGDPAEFRLIADAYHVLSDETRRAAYDASYVDGGALLDEVTAKLSEFVVFSSPEAATACTLYAAASYAAPRLEVAPRLVIKSPVPRCGKTRLLDVMGLLVNRPEKAGNISPAALVRLIDEHDPPTIILDETDVTFGAKRGTDEQADYLRQVLNLGFVRGYPYRRYNPASREVEDCPTFAMAILASIKDIPDTIMDRGVTIPMRRKAPNEKVTRFRQRIHPPVIRELAERLGDWAAPRSQLIAEAWPALPDELNDRAQDTWEPLLAVAEIAGGEWPARARAAALVLAADAAVDKGLGVRLLADLRTVFGDADRLPTGLILRRLHDLEESPWDEDKLNPHGLATLLADFDVRPKLLRFPDRPLRGYERAQLADTWGRYLPADDTSRQGNRYNRYNRYPVTPQVTASPISPVTEHSVTGEIPQPPDQASNGVTVVTDDPPGNEKDPQT